MGNCKEKEFEGIFVGTIGKDTFPLEFNCEIGTVNIIPFRDIVSPRDIIFHDPATIIMWSDGTKTVVKCHEEDTYDKEKGLALCYLKKFYCDNKSRKLNDILKYAGE